MKKIFICMFCLLQLTNAWAQEQMKGFFVKDEGNSFSVSSYGTDTLKYVPRFDVLYDNILKFHEFTWNISKKVFTQGELEGMKKCPSTPKIYVYLNEEGTILGMKLTAPKECKSIFTESKIKKTLETLQTS